MSKTCSTLPCPWARLTKPKKSIRTLLVGDLGEKRGSDKPERANIEVLMTKASTVKAKAAKSSPSPVLGFRQRMAKRNRGMAEAYSRGVSGLDLAKRHKMSPARVYEILRQAKLAGNAKPPGRQEGKGVVVASPVGRAQTLLVQVAVLKEAVRNALNSPKAKFSPKLGDEILGALASARTAEIAVKEASERLEAVKRRLQGKVTSGKMNGVTLGWKAVARAARLSASPKAKRT